METEADECEQYTRRPKLRISGIPEATNEVTNDLVIATIKKLGFHNTGISDLERSNRLARRLTIWSLTQTHDHRALSQ